MKITIAKAGDLILRTGGLMSPKECVGLARAAGHAAPGPALEVGNYTGLSTIVLSWALPAEPTLVTIDPHQWRGTIDEFDANVEEYGNPDAEVASIEARFEDVLHEWPGPPFGFVFYDGAHSAEHCELFWRVVEPLLTPKAVVCWDDADWESMARLRELVAGTGRHRHPGPPLRRHRLEYSTGERQVDRDLAKRHPDTYTLEVWQ